MAEKITRSFWEWRTGWVEKLRILFNYNHYGKRVRKSLNTDGLQNRLFPSFSSMQSSVFEHTFKTLCCCLVDRQLKVDHHKLILKTIISSEASVWPFSSDLFQRWQTPDKPQSHREILPNCFLYCFIWLRAQAGARTAKTPLLELRQGWGWGEWGASNRVTNSSPMSGILTNIWGTHLSQVCPRTHVATVAVCAGLLLRRDSQPGLTNMDVTGHPWSFLTEPRRSINAPG